MMNQKHTLFNELTEIFLSNKINNWKKTKPDYDLSNISGLKVIVHPYDAKTLNEVESFDIIEEVMGSITTSYSRKNL